MRLLATAGSVDVAWKYCCYADDMIAVGAQPVLYVCVVRQSKPVALQASFVVMSGRRTMRPEGVVSVRQLLPATDAACVRTTVISFHHSWETAKVTPEHRQVPVVFPQLQKALDFSEESSRQQHSVFGRSLINTDPSDTHV